MSESYRENKHVTIEIGNTGSYIKKEDLNKVFHRFWTCKKNYGRGLGLAISKKLIEEQGGNISCESNGFCSRMGKVTNLVEEHYVVFRMTLPLLFLSLVQQKKPLQNLSV